MCTVILAFKHFAGQPIRLVANRDEQLDRPAETFRLRQTDPKTLSPRDLVAGGTWIGVNEHGIAVAITNRFGAAPDPDRRSRGELVSMALQHTSVVAAADAIHNLDAAHYNGFHLTIASVDAAEIVWSDARQFTRVSLEPGLHVVTERSFEAADSPREHWLRSQLEHVSTPADLNELVLQRSDDGFNGTIVSVPDLNYGTRSSTRIALGDEVLLEHADGAPDEVPYDDRSAELAALLRS